MGDLLNKLGLRGSTKTLIILMVLALSTSLLLAEVISAEQWVELHKFVIPSFMAAQLIEKFSRKGDA